MRRMKNKKFLIGFFFLLWACPKFLCEARTTDKTETAQTAPAPHKTNSARVIHVVVALCDNQYQGIVPVPPLIGNGDDPARNLYWGAAFGVKSFFKKAPDWKLIADIENP